MPAVCASLSGCSSLKSAPSMLYGGARSTALTASMVGGVMVGNTLAHLSTVACPPQLLDAAPPPAPPPAPLPREAMMIWPKLSPAALTGLIADCGTRTDGRAAPAVSQQGTCTSSTRLDLTSSTNTGCFNAFTCAFNCAHVVRSEMLGLSKPQMICRTTPLSDRVSAVVTSAAAGPFAASHLLKWYYKTIEIERNVSKII